MQNQLCVIERKTGLSGKEKAMLGLSALAAALFAFGRQNWLSLPGAGLCACAWIVMAGYLLCLGGKKARWTGVSAALVAAWEPPHLDRFVTSLLEACPELGGHTGGHFLGGVFADSVHG